MFAYVDHMKKPYILKYIMYPCPYCKEYLRSESTLLLHVKTEHGTSRTLCSCRFDECMRTFKNIYSYKKHVAKVHVESPIVQSETHNCSNESISQGNQSTEQVSDNSVKVCSAQKINMNFCQLSSVNDSNVQTSSDSATNYENNDTLKSNSENNILLDTGHNNVFDIIDPDIKKFQNDHFMKTITLVSKLYANCALPRSVVQNILFEFGEFYNDSIEFVKKKT